MQLSLKFIAWFLLAIVMVLPVTAQISPLETSAPPAGCEEHGGSRPSQPSSYICCQGGHDTAAVQEVFTVPGCCGQGSSVSDSVVPLASFTGPQIAAVPLPSDSPPLSISLRI